MTKLQAIKKSIRHWEVMISWAKKQHPCEETSMKVMEDAINQEWSEDYCALCKLYLTDSVKNPCKGCPLAKMFGICHWVTRTNVWHKVEDANTWFEWIKYAEKMLKQLQKVLEKEGG